MSYIVWFWIMHNGRIHTKFLCYFEYSLNSGKREDAGFSGRSGSTSFPRGLVSRGRRGVKIIDPRPRYSVFVDAERIRLRSQKFAFVNILFGVSAQKRKLIFLSECASGPEFF